MSVMDLFEYMHGCLTVEYDKPANGVGWNGAEGGWLLPVMDSWDLLDVLDEPLAHEGLAELFAVSFDQQWCQRDPYSLAPHDRLVFGWQSFVERVRHERRYLFLRPAPSPSRAAGDEIQIWDMLDEVGLAIARVEHHLVRTSTAGMSVMRGRRHRPQESFSDAEALGSPPLHFTRPLRMSPAGISMFYAAEDLETVAAEVPATHEEPSRTVARWALEEDLCYLDLTDVPSVPSIFDMSASRERPWLRFLRAFATEISMPVSDQTAEVEYVPTQIFTEYIRHVFRTSQGRDLAGVRYNSAAYPGGVCWVLFQGPEAMDDSPGFRRYASFIASTVTRL